MTQPVYACSLDDEELAVRRADWRALEARALIRAETRPDGGLLVYRGGEATARALKGLIEAERHCCSFLDFRIDAADDEVRVSVMVPPGGTADGDRDRNRRDGLRARAVRRWPPHSVCLLPAPLRKPGS